MSARVARLAAVLVALAVASSAAGRDDTVLHEPIAPDARDDLAMGVTLAGDIPAAMRTRSGVFSAPDPTKPPSASELSRSARAAEALSSVFLPDRDTRRPSVLDYTDPFTPSTAPFKRLVAFDAVDPSFALYSYASRTTPLPVSHGSALPGEDTFYADLPVELAPDKQTRIPSVGPGARVLHAHLGAGARELPVILSHDGADNWFLDGTERTSARLVMELAIPRASFGGELGDPDWSALSATPVPDDVAAAAKDVFARIGLGRNLRPAENVRKMVAYFRAFVDSDQPLAASKDVYTDLAMSQKGVCRHRAYAFTITALALGIPTRMVVNEAHAWVEVFDGALWRRINLGGAGQMLSEDAKTAEPYAAPADAFPWPANATRGEDLTEKARQPKTPGGGSAASSASASASPSPSERAPHDARPASELTVDLGESAATRGAPVHVHGRVTAGGEPCRGLAVSISLRDARSKRAARIGTVATDPTGAFAAAIVVPPAVPLGDYEVVAETAGDRTCGRGVSR